MPLSRPIFNILLVGETGSGKSTLINYLANYFLKGTINNLKYAIQTAFHAATEHWVSEEKNLDDSRKSKTSACTGYEFQTDYYLLNFIDSPGLSDTEDTNQDDVTIEKIMSSAESTGTMTAVILVMNGSVARETSNLTNTLTRLRGCMPDELLPNLLLVLTNCTAATTNFNMKVLKPWTIADENVFYTNNSMMSKSEMFWAKLKSYWPTREQEWADSMKTIKALIEQITKLGHHSTRAFGEMREKKNQIKGKMHGLLLKVKKLQSTQDELDTIKSMKNDVANDVEKYSEYKHYKEIEYEELVECDEHNTVCMTHDRICHAGCGLGYKSVKGDQALAHCLCMGKISAPGLFSFFKSKIDGCTVCGCDYTTHYHDNKKLVKKKKTVEEVLENLKAEYDRHSKKDADLKKKITTLNADIDSLKSGLSTSKNEIVKLCEDLKKLCSNFNFVDELQAVIGIMKENARSLTSTEARAEAEERIKQITCLIDDLSKSSK